MTPVPAEPIPPAIRQQALAWYSLTQAGDISAEQLHQLERWRQADSEHERAWQRIATLQQPPHANGDRRRLLKLLACVSLLGAVGWQGRRSQWVQGRLADVRTATGERRRQVLADGTQLWLNTATAVDVAFTATERRIFLHYGEINVLTGTGSGRRPLLVQTTEADLRPQGTRFSVRCGEGCAGTRVSVSSGQVAATLRHGPAAHVVQAGQQAQLEPGSLSVDLRAPLDDAWVDGLVIAQDTRLGELVAQLARYRPGILRCDPQVADLRVSGAYPLDDNERILALLAASLPISLQRRTRYWVTLVPKASV